ncbi:MAG TPA: DUF5808 domain-containing protein [Polyangiaceae bacterium]|nr:DUF5808 domain-containing protein [Polyangiaceae bacterium]
MAPTRSPFPRWPSFAVLAAAAAYLAVRWDSIPPRWVIHWSAAGRPNGWSERSWLGVFGPLLLAFAVAVFFEVLSAITSRRSMTNAAMVVVNAATRDLLRAVTFGLCLVGAVLAIDLPLGPRLPSGALVALLAIPIAVTLVMGTARLAEALRQVRRAGHGAKVEGYHALYYSNPKDERLWVPKLSGMGLTINFAHRWAWPMMAILLGVPIAIAIASVLGSRAH